MAETVVRSPADLDTVREQLDAMKMPFRVTIRQPETRSEAQNRTLHKWFGEIALHRGDVTPVEVKAECNLEYGSPIKRRDDEDWNAVFGWVFRGLNYEQKLKAIRTLDVPFTRDMTVKQLSEYMEQVQRDYLAQGVSLTIPEDK